MRTKNRQSDPWTVVSLWRDPFSKGKMSIRAGYGVFWEQIRLIGYNRFSTAQPFALSRNITSPGNPSNNFAPSLSGDLIYTNSGQINPFPFVTPRTAEQRANYYPAYKGRWVAPALESFFNPAWNQAYVQQFNLSIQQELWQNYAFTVAYVGNKATHLWTARELNPAIHFH